MNDRETMGVVLEKGVDRFWGGRVLDMLTYIACRGNGHFQPTKQPVRFVGVSVRNGKSWPMRGLNGPSSVVVEDEEGRRWKLELSKGDSGNFQVREMLATGSRIS